MPLDHTPGNGKTESGPLFTTSTNSTGLAEGYEQLVKHINRQTVAMVLDQYNNTVIISDMTSQNC